MRFLEFLFIISGILCSDLKKKRNLPQDIYLELNAKVIKPLDYQDAQFKTYQKVLSDKYGFYPVTSNYMHLIHFLKRCQTNVQHYLKKSTRIQEDIQESFKSCQALISQAFPSFLFVKPKDRRAKSKKTVNCESLLSEQHDLSNLNSVFHSILEHFEQIKLVYYNKTSTTYFLEYFTNIFKFFTKNIDQIKTPDDINTAISTIEALFYFRFQKIYVGMENWVSNLFSEIESAAFQILLRSRLDLKFRLFPELSFLIEIYCQENRIYHLLYRNEIFILLYVNIQIEIILNILERNQGKNDQISLAENLKCLILLRTFYVPLVLKFLRVRSSEIKDYLSLAYCSIYNHLCNIQEGKTDILNDKSFYFLTNLLSGSQNNTNSYVSTFLSRVFTKSTKKRKTMDDDGQNLRSSFEAREICFNFIENHLSEFIMAFSLKISCLFKNPVYKMQQFKDFENVTSEVIAELSHLTDPSLIYLKSLKIRENLESIICGYNCTKIDDKKSNETENSK
ncbi:hypothetical protein M153_3250001404 [Pseudoloma neurophilia]|uniref:Uncharacterized protein n=1 Tax=Pseudoloma neurophilia TaxID=146866 RepID=A0A0R0LYG9_9MICR|nr:hypothetical protein M153_3250001404 [Pseudoloma neurophilia]